MHGIVDFSIHAVSSKQRSSLRRSLTTDRKKISKLVTQYQILSRQIGEEPPVEKDVLEGNFPWSALTGYDHILAMHCIDYIVGLSIILLYSSHMYTFFVKVKAVLVCSRRWK